MMVIAILLLESHYDNCFDLRGSLVSSTNMGGEHIWLLLAGLTKYLATISRLIRRWCVHIESKRVKVGEIVASYGWTKCCRYHRQVLHFSGVKIERQVDSGVESPSRWLQVANLLKLGPLLPPVDPLHQVLYVAQTRVASLLPLGAFQVEVVLVGGGGEAGGAETGRGEKSLGRRVR